MNLNSGNENTTVYNALFMYLDCPPLSYLSTYLGYLQNSFSIQKLVTFFSNLHLCQVTLPNCRAVHTDFLENSAKKADLLLQNKYSMNELQLMVAFLRVEAKVRFQLLRPKETSKKKNKDKDPIYLTMTYIPVFNIPPLTNSLS